MRCDTRYPILLVHGAGFRDRRSLNYWGRIPKALQAQGAVIFYGNQDAWGDVAYSAGVLQESLAKVLAETGAEKVNILAHSKGGLEARYLISSLGMADCVASLTTIFTPHHGSKTMDLLCRLPRPLFRLAAFFVNPFFRLFGDKQPDFFNATRHFTQARMKQFNAENPDMPQVFYQSYASAMKSPFSDILMCFPALLVWLIEGENDGLLTPKAATWTNFQGTLRGATHRGISHADVVDARRMNFSRKSAEDGVADIREVYLEIVAGLKARGL